MAKAVSLLKDDVYGDFPFEDEASPAHLISLTLLPFVREMIDGPTPIHAISKPAPGTGASLMVEGFSLLAYGETIAGMAEPKGDEEFNKVIVSALLDSMRVFWIDNLNKPLDSGAFAAMVTNGRFAGRLLGNSKMIDAPVRFPFIVSANAFRCSDEMARRCAPILIDSCSEDPTKGREFKHPDLKIWIKENRSELVWACLTIIQSWMAEGQVPGKENFASFESWSAVMGGILANAGITGFLENKDAFRDKNNDRMSNDKAFIMLWYETFGVKETRLGKLEFAVSADEFDDSEPKTLVEVVLKHSDRLTFSFQTGPTNSWGQRLGFVLGKLNKKTFNLENSAGDTVTVFIEKRRTRNGVAYCICEHERDV